MKVTESYSAKKILFLLWQPGMRLAHCAMVGGGHDKGELEHCFWPRGISARRRGEEAEGEEDEWYVGRAVTPRAERPLPQPMALTLPWPHVGWHIEGEWQHSIVV